MVRRRRKGINRTLLLLNGDIQLISKLMERTERSIQIRLEMLELLKRYKLRCIITQNIQKWHDFETDYRIYKLKSVCLTDLDQFLVHLF